MNYRIDKFFDNLQLELERLDIDKNIDNEAMRHDLIIRPLLTNPLTLAWEGRELISQKTIEVPKEVQKSYFWTYSIPKKRRPDMIIAPYGFNKTIAIIEEKKAGIKNLKHYLGQVKEYQYLHNATWGLLTDGQKWILQKNNEIYHVFNSLSDIKKRLKDLQECIGKKAILERLIKYGTADIVKIVSTPKIIILPSLFDINLCLSDSIIDNVKSTPENKKHDQFIMSYLPSVKFNAQFTANFLPTSIDIDDLIEVGIIAVIDSYRKFGVSENNVKSKIYVASQIRGYIFTEFQDKIWTNQFIEKIDPINAKLAKEINMPLKQFQKFIKKLQEVSGITDEDLIKAFNLDEMGYIQECLLSAQKKFFERIDNKQIKESIVKITNNLAPKEKEILTLHYWDGMSLNEISSLTGMFKRTSSMKIIDAMSHIKRELRKIN